MAAERHVKMLAVKGEVLAFQYKSFSSKTRDHRKGSEVSFYSLSFAQDSQSFSIRDRNLSLIHKDSSAETDVVHCCSALDIQQRQKVPCVLLRLCKKRTSAFKYMLYSICTSTDAKLHAEFVLPYEMRDNISILLGPTLIWSHENSVFYTSSQTSGVKEVPIPMTVNFIGELPLRQRKLVIQGAQNVPSDQSKVKNILYFIEDGRTLSAACLVPDAYSSVIQCMMVLSAEEFDGGWRSAVLAATSMKQLVRFENGLPLDVCLLPYEQPLSIQVAGCWTGVRLLLVDDFMGCGMDQMLLVFESSSAEPLSSFLLTDLCAVTYSCCRSDGEELNSSDAAQENHLLTVQALESRLQSGLSVLEDLQRDVEVKDRLLQQSLVALTDLVSGREHAISSPEQEGLVSLWDEDDDDDGAGDEEDAGMQTECAEAPLKMHRVWQRVIGQSLIVGVVLTSTNNTSVMNISASIVLDSHQTGTAPVLNTKTVILPYPVAHGPSPVKIRRSDCSADSDGSRLALVAVTDAAPLLTSGCVRCPIMLHYSSKESPGSAAGECARVSQHCGQISLGLEDISMGKLHPRLLQEHRLNTDEARDDLLSLLALLDVWFFRLECPGHTLADVQGWLQESLRFERLEIDPRFTADPSSVRLFRWEQNSPFQGVLSIYCRDELSLLHFLHSLCDFLPVSHDVQPLERPSFCAGSLAQTLQTEIHTVTQEASSALRSDEGVRRGEAESQTLHTLREEWLKERGRCNERLRPLLDETRYSRLIERIIHAQLDADEAALMEAPRFGCRSESALNDERLRELLLEIESLVWS
ncbi:Fanconi anemia group B protein isoform X3 [Sinocyclocheilus anshuiensis]|uniref:Fanconi anemia group B protein isoform X3 n=1 Tax=Sinocyclocheilus anshuiensis TaxID=1608454 RepID=UPI0007B819DD|nr:PREDICTED: Fanconi anemia group B protein isoform X3 [Sinocyclocheilus anshuiensis]